MRRLLLSVMVIAMSLTVLDRRAGASSDDDPTIEIEASGWGGRTTGGFLCGPVAKVNYGGGGVRVRVTEDPPNEEDEDDYVGQGWSGTMAGAMEHETVEFQDEDTCFGGECQLPSTPSASLLLASRLTFGYSWRLFTLEAGATFYEAFHDELHSEPKLTGQPDVWMTIGRTNFVYGIVGTGSPALVTLRRPAAVYGGLGYFTDGFRFEMHAGLHRAGISAAAVYFTQIEPRLHADFQLPIPATEQQVRLRIGAAVAYKDAVDFEGSGGVVVFLPSAH